MVHDATASRCEGAVCEVIQAFGHVLVRCGDREYAVGRFTEGVDYRTLRLGDVVELELATDVPRVLRVLKVERAR